MDGKFADLENVNTGCFQVKFVTDVLEDQPGVTNTEGVSFSLLV